MKPEDENFSLLPFCYFLTVVNFRGDRPAGLVKILWRLLTRPCRALSIRAIMMLQAKRKDKDMFTATVINPAGTYVATFTTLDAAEEWAFCGAYFVRGVSRVEVRNNAGEVVSWY